MSRSQLPPFSNSLFLCIVSLNIVVDLFTKCTRCINVLLFVAAFINGKFKFKFNGAVLISRLRVDLIPILSFNDFIFIPLGIENVSGAFNFNTSITLARRDGCNNGLKSGNLSFGFNGGNFVGSALICRYLGVDLPVLNKLEIN